MAGYIVGVPGLRLKGEEDGDPLIGRGKAEDEAAVLPHSIIVPVPGIVALIHMDVVNAVARIEMEDLVRGPRLRAPARAESEDLGGCLACGAIDIVGQSVAQVVVVARQARREQAHVESVEEVPADEIERGRFRLPRQQRVSLRQGGQSWRKGVAEVLDDDKQQLGRAQLRLDIDGNAVVYAGSGNLDLEVRSVVVVLTS